MTLSRELNELWPQTPAASAHLRVTGITADSRDAKAGDVFVALKGLTRDAREFIDQVIGQGVVAVFADQDDLWPEHTTRHGVPVIVIPLLGTEAGRIAARFYGDPTREMTVLAVTGTNGKTSVSHLLAGALTQLGKKSAVVGTIGNGIYGELQSATHTTPDAIRLQELFAEFREAGVEYAAIEASSHGLQQGRLNGTHIHTALYTNLTRDHLDYHGDMVTYAAAKARLFAWAGLKAAVLNADDEQEVRLRRVVDASVNVANYSLHADMDADITAVSVQPSLSGLSIDVRTPQGSMTLHSALLGRFNVSNLLAVLGGLLSLGIPLSEAVAALGKVRPVAGRMECFATPGLPTVVVDYAHTPDALEKALSSLREHTTAKLWCVFGCGGDRDTGKRPQMAKIAESLADRVVLTSDNPRSENPEQIIRDVQAGFAQAASVMVEADRHVAIRRAIADAGDDDIVLVAGKGHEDYQEIQGVRHFFSDVVEVKAALAERRNA